VTTSRRVVLAGDDWRTFREIRLRALADAPDAFGTTLAQAEGLPDDVWRERAEGPGPTLLVLEDGRPVAMGGLFPLPAEGRAMIWGMWTAPEARGRGLGSRLLGQLVARARARGLEVFLHVTEGNEAARRLYLEHGFAPTGEWEPLREGSDLRIELLRLHP
jgi:ribosomal protein S18 acetylase RimI-like enzyme